MDIRENAPAIILAKENNLFTTTSIEEIFSKPIDLIIEVTGNKSVEQELINKNNENIPVMNSYSAELMMHLVDYQEGLNLSLEKNVEEVEELSSKLENFIKETLENIQKSDELVKYMNKVTKQTNILGLNASIEASRAGDAGRGFSVVAKEVQNLAQNSEKLAQQINDILGKISSDVENTYEMVNELKEASKQKNS